MSNIKNGVSKSNITEIISLLYVLCATQTTGFWHWVFIVLAVENLLESWIFSIYFRMERSSK